MFNDAHGRDVKEYKGNNRFIQPPNGRKVLFFDSGMVKCGTPTIYKDVTILQLFQVLDDGHFEKFKGQEKSLFYVEGEQESGIPNAKPVDKEENEDIIK